MPLYEFACRECQTSVDIIKKSARDLNKQEFCPKCGEQLDQVIAPPSRFIRGSGSWSSPA